jgi:hypothetical protein
MPRIWTEEQKQALRDNLARGRETRKANAKARREAPKVAAAPADFTDTPEFKAAFAAQKDELLRAVAQHIVSQAPATPGDSLQKTMEQLALTIGDLTNQNSGQKLVSPEVLAERREAMRKMEERLEQVRDHVRIAEQEGNEKVLAEVLPRYRLNAKIIAPLMNGDEIVEPVRRGADNRVYPTELDWLLPPNLAMVPLNEPAQEIFALFKRSIGNQISTRLNNHTQTGDPVFGAETDRYFVTNQGRVVTAGSQTDALRHAVDPGPTEPLVQRGMARIRGQDAMRQHSGPPTIQVRVLGTIAPPAVQNG